MFLANKIAASANFIRARWPCVPQAGIILGTGLGNLVHQIDIDCSISYADIPHFPSSTSIGHRGRLVCGRIDGVAVVAMQGRFHRYEGHSSTDITLSVRVMKELGAHMLIVSNASGGLNPQFQSGDVMVIDDHINLMGANPLIGMNDADLGPRFPDMCSPYDPGLIEHAVELARKHGFNGHRGVYAAMSGPNYETRAEYRFLRQIGADVVGMSTVPEVIVGVHCGLKVLGLSAVTNECRPDTLNKTEAQDVVDAAQLAEPKMRVIVGAIISNLH